MIKLVIIAMGLVIFGALCLQWVGYMQRPGGRKKAIKGVSTKDAERYAGKYVMTDGHCGPVVGSGDTFEEMIDDISRMNDDVLNRLVHVYIPRKGE